MNKFLAFLILLNNFVCCRSACTFPSDLIGEWYSTSFGTLNFASDQSFSGFTSDLSAAPLTFTCFESSGSQYVSMTTNSLFTGVIIDVYLCMNIQQISSIKYYFTLDNDKDTATGIRFYTPAASGDAVTLLQACTRSDTRSAGEYELLIKKDAISSAVTACPTNLQSTFNVNMTTGSADNCEGTQMEGSTGALVFNYSSCVTGQFNSGGYLQCLYSVTSTYSYVTLYNNDTATDEISTYIFTCLVYETDGGTLRATESPNSCHTAQSPTSVDSPGITYVMTDLLYTTEERDFTTIIIVVCCIAGAIIIIVVIIVVYFKFCRKPKPEPPPKLKKLKRKRSITEYTPRSLGRGTSVESLDECVVHKQSTGEIITGVLADKKHKHALQNGNEYEPPKREAWQKKWETDGHKMSPRLTKESLNRMKQSFSSDREISRLEELSVSDLDKAYTLSTSLPDSLDIPIQQSPRKTDAAPKSPDAVSMNHRYSERSHASPSIPASTGKFGESVKITSIESIQHSSIEHKLDTISENPLSRENTATAITQKKNQTKPLKEHPNLTRFINSDVASLSTVLTSQGTASVGDICLQNSFQNISSSRNSYLSASNASIFDDPGWLMENKKLARDRDFESIKNLIPSIPKEKERDLKWFMKSQKKPEVTREDIDYFKSRNKSYVGLNASLGQGSSNSLEVIARGKMRKEHKKSKHTKPKLIRPVSPHFED